MHTDTPNDTLIRAPRILSTLDILAGSLPSDYPDMFNIRIGSNTLPALIDYRDYPETPSEHDYPEIGETPDVGYTINEADNLVRITRLSAQVADLQDDLAHMRKTLYTAAYGVGFALLGILTPFAVGIR